MSNQLKVWLALLAGAGLCYFQPLGGALLALGAFAFEYLSERQGEDVATLSSRVDALTADVRIAEGLNNDAHRRLREAEKSLQEIQDAKAVDAHQRALGLR